MVCVWVCPTAIIGICRRGHKLLQMVLPEKEEHILFVRLSPLQSSLYNRYIESQGKILGVNAIKAFAICCKVEIEHRL